MKYCENPYQTIRRSTHEVMVGKIGIGKGNPIRIQSMTNTNTMDTDATVKQVIELYDAGCEIVRITAPSNRDAENLGNIKRRLAGENIQVPLVADIHFTPNAALIAADFVEKVRVNPGNYAEKGVKSSILSDSDYQIELERIEEKFRPLVIKCKEFGVAMRIGTNHGSLSERILSRFGDTAEGMVESAMEFVYFAEAQGFNQIVLSMKASNPVVMINAYRLLTARLYKENRTYPLHLGVTEAGGGLEGRIKSSSGIFSLLQDGLGDTIRVSLTESPVAEIPVARSISDMFNSNDASSPDSDSIFAYPKMENKGLDQNGGLRQKRSFHPLTDENIVVQYRLKKTDDDALRKEIVSLKALDESRRPDIIMIDAAQKSSIDALRAMNYAIGFFADKHEIGLDFDMISLPFDAIKNDSFTAEDIFVEIRYPLPSIAGKKVASTRDKFVKDLDLIKELNRNQPVIIGLTGALPFGAVRLFFEAFRHSGLSIPVIFHYEGPDKREDMVLHAAGLLGGLLMDGFGDGICIENTFTTEQEMDIAFNILQSARLRITQTEFISCPSCGRTLFDLEETTARIKKETGHLKGLKIGVMGCIVNGPGEMADADFGYVGAGKGKINLYVGHEVVKKNIPTVEATDELIQLIKDHGKWVDPLPA